VVAVEPAAYDVVGLTSQGALHGAVVDLAWDPVEKPGKNVVSRAVFFHYPPCCSKGRQCGHALTVNALQGRTNGGDELLNAMENAEEVTVAELAARMAPSTSRGVQIPRRSRNPLPFSEEVRQCAAFGALSKAHDQDVHGWTPANLLHEAHCKTPRGLLGATPAQNQDAARQNDDPERIHSSEHRPL